jgi:LCP family protein required for cell wall assembly
MQRHGDVGQDVDTVGPGSVPDQPPHDPPDEPPTRKSRRRWPRILLISGIVLVVLVGGGCVAVALYVNNVQSKVQRVDAFSSIPAQARPEKPVPDAENFLILGSDTRDPNNTTGSRTDTIILVHMPKGRGSAQLVSIPRDTWVRVPKSADGQHGGVDAKINAAFAWGGVPLVVQTIESFTNVRIDHVAIVDFSGFEQIIDALGGVDIYVDQNFTSTHSLLPSHKRVFTKGMTHMDGAMALDYSRERYVFADGDFTRIKHQQQMIKAVLDKAASGGLLTNPVGLNSFLTATAKAVSVDKSMSLIDTAMELRGLRSDNLKFGTSPSSGTGMVGDQSVVFANTGKARDLFDAIRQDNVSLILADMN